MSLLARFLESEGIPTVAIYLQQGMAESVPSPRMLLVRWPFGHPYGEPNRPVLQAQVLHRALEVARDATRFGELVKPEWPWRRTPVELPETWQKVVA